MPPFENADAAFASGSPLLSFFEPTLLLLLLAFLAFGGTAGNGDSLHAQFLGRRLVGAGEEPRVGRRQIRNPIQQLLMFFDGRRQQVGIAGALVEYLKVDDDLVLQLPGF